MGQNHLVGRKIINIYGKNRMPKTWPEITKQPGYKSLPVEEKEEARRQYFDAVISPKVPREDTNIAWEQFSESAKQYDEGPSLISRGKEVAGKLKGAGMQKPVAGKGYADTTPISTITGKPVASDWTTDPMWKGMPDVTKEWALDQIMSKKMTFEQVKAELGGVKMPAYDPTDIVIDVATLGTSAVGRRALQAGLKPTVKFATGQLAAGLGAGAGLSLTMDTELGILPQMLSAIVGSSATSSVITGLRTAGKQSLLKAWGKRADKIATQKLAAKTAKETAEALASEARFRDSLAQFYQNNKKVIASTLSDVEKAELPELAFVKGQWVQVPQKVRVEKDIAESLAEGIEAKAIPGETSAEAMRRETQRIATGGVVAPGQPVVRRERTFLPEAEMPQPAKTGKITKFTTPIPTETPAEQLRRAGKFTTTGQKWLATGKEARKRGDTTLSFLGTGKIKEFFETPTGREVGGAAIGAGIGAAAADDDDRFTGAIVGAGVGYGTAKGGEAILRRIFKGSPKTIP
ncbi:MAG: hypothetical protein Q8M94_10495, partial [Ignavibacteria bacterium]|nr:hypothetical protein [Ignavibacteria bacterium]